MLIIWLIFLFEEGFARQTGTNPLYTDPNSVTLLPNPPHYSQTSVPASEQPLDYDTLYKQKVAVLEGSIADFTEQGSPTSFRTGSVKVKVQQYVKPGRCVKVVSIQSLRHRTYIEHIIVPCDAEGEVSTDDEDLELNVGNVIFVEDAATITAVVKDGVCVRSRYTVERGQVTRTRARLSPQDCYQLTRLTEEERKSEVKLTVLPRSKKEVPGPMTLLSMEDSVRGYTASSPAVTYYPSSPPHPLAVNWQDYHRGSQECVRLLAITVEGAVADRVRVSCGRVQGLHLSPGEQHLQYRRAFTVRLAGTDTLTALFNVQGEHCVQRVYSVHRQDGGIVTVVKSPDITPDETECADLKSGKHQNNNNVSGGTTRYGNQGGDPVTNTLGPSTVHGNNIASEVKNDQMNQKDNVRSIVSKEPAGDWAEATASSMKAVEYNNRFGGGVVGETTVISESDMNIANAKKPSLLQRLKEKISGFFKRVWRFMSGY